MEEKAVQKLHTDPAGGENTIVPPKAVSVSEIVQRLETLVRYALECENRPLRDEVSFVEVYRQLIGVQKAINSLDKDQKDLINMMSRVAGVSPEAFGSVSSSDVEHIEKLKKLETMCEEAQDRLHASMTAQPEAGRELKEKLEESTLSDKTKAIRRKGKFKKMGGAGGWVRT